MRWVALFFFVPMCRMQQGIPHRNLGRTDCLDDFGHPGRAWRETDEAGTNRATLVCNLLEGQYENPVLIVAFNTAERWSRDVTLDIADELRRSYPEFDEVPASVLRFLETTNRH